MEKGDEERGRGIWMSPLRAKSGNPYRHLTHRVPKVRDFHIRRTQADRAQSTFGSFWLLVEFDPCGPTPLIVIVPCAHI